MLLILKRNPSTVVLKLSVIFSRELVKASTSLVLRCRISSGHQHAIQATSQLLLCCASLRDILIEAPLLHHDVDLRLSILASVGRV